MRRETRIDIRCNRMEKHLLEKLAERDQRTLSEWVRERIRNEAQRHGLLERAREEHK